MRTDTANKLLKVIEEPPAKTVFILLADSTENFLATISEPHPDCAGPSRWTLPK